MNIDLNDMALFAVIAEHLSISETAKALNIPKSKISRRLANLESQLDTRLIERNTRRMRLTESGARLLVHCQRVIDEKRSAVATLSELNDEPQGILSVSASVSMGQHIVTPHLASFLTRYPKIQLRLMLDNRRVDLIGEGFDIALRVGKLDDSSLISKRLGGDRIGLYASPNYLANNAHLACIDDLSNHRIIRMGDMRGGGISKLYDQQGLEYDINEQPIVEVNDLTVVRDLVIEGTGIAAIPTFLVANAISTGRLQRVLPSYSTKPFDYYAVYPSRFGLSNKARAFIDYYSDVFENY